MSSIKFYNHIICLMLVDWLSYFDWLWVTNNLIYFTMTFRLTYSVVSWMSGWPSEFFLTLSNFQCTMYVYTHTYSILVLLLIEYTVPTLLVQCSTLILNVNFSIGWFISWPVRPHQVLYVHSTSTLNTLYKLQESH